VELDAVTQGFFLFQIAKHFHMLSYEQKTPQL